MSNIIRPFVVLVLVAVALSVAAQTVPEARKRQKRQDRKTPPEAVMPIERPMIVDNGVGVDTLALGDRFSVRTNATDWLMLIPNAGVEFDIKNVNYSRYAIGINLRYNWQTDHTYNPGMVYNIAEARIDFRNYFRVKVVDNDERYWKFNRHKHIWDKVFSARHKKSKHPDAVFYRGAYLAFTKYSLMFGSEGRQGTAVSAGYQFGIVKPLYVFRNGHSVDLDLGVALGVTYTSYDKYRLDRESNCYPVTGKVSGQVLPMVNELRCALTYRFGKTPSTSKYRWRYDVDADYQYVCDTIHTAEVRHRIDVQTTDSIQSLIRKDFWAVYDSLLVVERASADSVNRVKVLEQKAKAASLKPKKASAAETSEKADGAEVKPTGEQAEAPGAGDSEQPSESKSGVTDAWHEAEAVENASGGENVKEGER